MVLEFALDWTRICPMRIEFKLGKIFAEIIAKRSLGEILNNITARPMETIKSHGRIIIT